MPEKNIPNDPPMVWCHITGRGSGRYVDSCPGDMVRIKNVAYEGYIIGIYAPRCGATDCTFYRTERGDAVIDSKKPKQTRITKDFTEGSKQ
jgi:hypothetical protein